MLRPPMSGGLTTPSRQGGVAPLIAVLCALLCSVTLASCAGVGKSVQAPSSEVASAPSDGGGSSKDAQDGDKAENGLPPLVTPTPESSVSPAKRDEFVMVFTDSNLELNPLRSYSADEAQLFTGLYEGLFTYNPLTLEPVPAVAQKYELSEDKTVWTFHLRPNARYWNGSPVLASHFRDAWLRMIDPADDNPYSSLFDLIKGAKEYRLGKSKDPASVGIQVVDERTLKVTLASPASFFARVLCHHSFDPIHPDMLKLKDWSTGAVIGNGPYYLYERKADRLILKKNELYWDAARVSIPTVVVRFEEDGVAAAKLWNSGAAQWVAGSVDLDSLASNRGISIHPMFATHYYYFRCSIPSLSNKKVRRALAIALPWKEIRTGYLLPATTLIYPIPGYPELKGLEDQDLEGAKALLSEAGFAGGKGIDPLVIRIPPAADAKRIAALMQTAWASLGVTATIDEVPFGRYFDSLKGDDYAVGSTTWIGDFADPYTFLQMWRRDSNLNDPHFSDSDYEALMDKSLLEDGEQRYTTLSEAEKILISTGAVLPISYTPALNVIDTEEIDGWYPNGLDMHPMKYFSYATRKPLPGVAMLTH